MNIPHSLLSQVYESQTDGMRLLMNRMASLIYHRRLHPGDQNPAIERELAALHCRACAIANSN